MKKLLFHFSNKLSRKMSPGLIVFFHEDWQGRQRGHGSPVVRISITFYVGMEFFSEALYLERREFLNKLF